MFEVPVQKIWVTEAFQRNIDMGELHNSITKGEGNMCGFIGEYVIADLMGVDILDTNDYDMISEDQRIEVKTKRSNPVPKAKYEASVANFNTNQACDYYFFTRVRNRMDKAYVLGFYPKTKFYEDATFRKKGEWDFSNGFKFHADCYNIPHNILWGWEAKTPEEFKTEWRRLIA